MLRRIRRKPLWLVAFVGGVETDPRALKTYIDSAVNMLSLPRPHYEIMEIPSDKTQAFPTGKTVEHELSELFSDAVLNPLINKKKQIKATDAALVIFRNAFPDEEVFKETLRETRYESSIFHLACSWTDFLHGSDKRQDCYKRCCSECGEMGKSCSHSCLPRLLWLLFDKNDAVLQVVKKTPR